MSIRPEDLLTSFRRHLRAAAEAPRRRRGRSSCTSPTVRSSSRWLTDRGREQVLGEPTRHAINAWLAELAEPTALSTVGIETSTAVCSAARAALFLPSSGSSVPSGLLGPPGRTDMG